MPTFSLQAGGNTSDIPAAPKTKNAQKMALFQTKNALATAIRNKSGTALDVKQVTAEMKRLLHKTYYGPKAHGKAPALSYHQALQRALDDLKVGGGGDDHRKIPAPKTQQAKTQQAKTQQAKTQQAKTRAKTQAKTQAKTRAPAQARAPAPAKAKAQAQAQARPESASKVLSTVVPVHTRLVQSVDLEFR